MINTVKEFREKFNLGVKSEVVNLELHKKLIKEEFDELIEAIDDGDKPNTVKEAVDLAYVVLGLLIDQDLDKYFKGMFEIVANNNLEKLGKDGKPSYRADGKLEKPEGFKKVNPLAAIKAIDSLIMIEEEEALILKEKGKW